MQEVCQVLACSSFLNWSSRGAISFESDLCVALKEMGLPAFDELLTYRYEINLTSVCAHDVLGVPRLCLTGQFKSPAPACY